MKTNESIYIMIPLYLKILRFEIVPIKHYNTVTGQKLD